MRRKEIFTLKWDQIRNGFIYVQKTKTNESREIPINNDLDRLLKGIRKDQQFKSKYVSTYNGLKVKRVDRAFLGALKRGGLKTSQVP